MSASAARQTRREQLLDLAETLLERDGLERFGVNALARESGIRPPSLYKHFAGAAEIEHALVSRFLRRLAAVLDDAEDEEARRDRHASATARRIAAFAAAYRGAARREPQLYRLATERPLDRGLLEPGSEAAAMGTLLRLFGEDAVRHDRARLLWAAAHGLVSLEISGRFPPDADIDAAWELLAQSLGGSDAE